jgi:peptidoglycan-associated lipoprotein
MNRILSMTALVAVSLALAGCPSKKTPVKAPATAGESVSGQAGTTSGAKDMGAGEAQPLAGGTGGADAGVLKTSIYFDFDSSEIRPEFASVLAAHGKKLAGDRTIKVRLEGNTDERGSAEYNVALGERRAQAVKRALLLQGSGAPQLTTVSYGEERPVAEGHDETAWAQNRRVDVVYLGGR